MEKHSTINSSYGKVIPSLNKNPKLKEAFNTAKIINQLNNEIQNLENEFLKIQTKNTLSLDNFKELKSDFSEKIRHLEELKKEPNLDRKESYLAKIKSITQTLNILKAMYVHKSKTIEDNLIVKYESILEKIVSIYGISEICMAEG